MQNCKYKRATSEMHSETYVNKVSEEYMGYLMGEGGLLSKPVAHQQCLKLRQILTGCQVTDVSTLTNPSTVETLQKWFIEYGKMHNPRSAVSYISIIVQYVDFLSNKVKFPSEELENMKSKMKKLKRLVLKFRYHSAHKKEELSPLDVNKYESSEIVKHALRNILDCIKKGK